MGQPLPEEEWKDFRNWFDDTIVPFLTEQGIDYFEYGTDSKELSDMFQLIFADINISSDNQKIFRWSGIGVNLRLPAGYQIEKVDRAFLQQEYENKEYILDELKRAYGDIELYFEQGIFYVAIHRKRIVARADMLFRDNKYGNISVNTEKMHRRKGVSAYLTMKAVEDTCKLGLIPIWDCTNDNLASEMTAKKCGFQMIQKDIIYNSNFALE